MVVLSVSVLNKKGATLLARQFVPMSRLRIEGLLAAFPKLIYSDDNARSKQHTFIETDEVRYIYQPMDNLYILLITNMQSNIIEDLNTLRLVAKLVPDYCMGHDETAVKTNAFELCFAIDEVISPMGYREAVTAKDIQKFCEMDSAEEKLSQIIEDSKIHTQQEFMKEKAKSFDAIRTRARQAMGGPGGGLSSISSTSDFMNQISSGISALRTRGFGGSGSGGAQRSYPLVSTGKMEGFGSDSLPQSSGGGGGGGSSGGFGASASSSSSGSGSSSAIGFDSGDEDSRKDRYTSSSSRKSSKRSGPRTKGFQLKKGGGGGMTDDLMRDALKADQSEMNTSAEAALRDLKSMAAARASGASALSAMASSSTAAAEAMTGRSGPMTDVEVSVSEKFSIKLDREGIPKSFDIRGDFEIAINNPDCAQAILVLVTDNELGINDEIEDVDSMNVFKAPQKKSDKYSSRIAWKLHPRMDAKLWNLKGVLKLKELDKKYKIGRACKTSVLKWRMACKNEEAIPLSVDYWPELELGKIHVTLQYNILMELPQKVNDVMISMPLPQSVVGKGAEIDVESIEDGSSYNFDKRNGELTWVIDGDQCNEGDSGMFEFRVEPGSGGHSSTDALWPLSVHFNIENGLFSGLRVLRVCNPDSFDLKSDLSSIEEFDSDIQYACHADSFIIGEDASSD